MDPTHEALAGSDDVGQGNDVIGSRGHGREYRMPFAHAGS